MRVLVLAALVGVMAPAAGCGGGHRKSTAPAPWVKRANALCRVDDRKIHGDFDSARMISGLRREVRGLERLGFFTQVPDAALAMETAIRLLQHADGGDLRTLRKVDRALLRARRDAAHRGVHCSFAAVSLANL